MNQRSMLPAPLSRAVRLTRLAAILALAACGDSGSGPGPTPGSNTPPPSAGHALVYHPGLQRVLLVNAGLGASSPPSTERTRLWAWDGAHWTVIDSAGPPIRNLGGVAYDSAREVLVVHGGTYSAQLSYGDTWEWKNGRGWVELNAPGPGTRDHTQMAYDVARARTVLFGGQSSLTSFPADTWTWDGVHWESVATAGPAPRVHHAMQYEPRTQRVVLFGGYEPNVRDRGDTWEWTGLAWEDVPPEQTARTHGRMAFDEHLGALVLVGGGQAGDPILVRGSNGWQPLTAAGGPSSRYLAGVAYDQRRQRLVVFGGGDPSSSALFADTWEFDGTSWSRP
jgi:hypothetical protein